MATITARITISDGDLAAGWGGDIAELSASVRATLGEIIGDDGGAYVPEVQIHI